MMEGNKTLYITLLGLAGIVAILGFSLNNSTSLDAAAAIWDREISADGYHSECTEVQDQLHEFSVKGIVDYKKYRYYDFCSGDRLFQVSCASSVRVGLLHGYDCPNGCENGACLS